MSLATVNGQQLYFTDSGGDGPVVIFGHGFLMDHEMFEHQVAAFGDRYRIITWDSRCFGQTTYDGNGFTYWDSARDCLGLLEHLGIERAIIAGMSQGGYLGLRAALLAPERVAGLILLNTCAGVDDAETIALYQAMMVMWASNGPTDDLVQAVAQIIIADELESARWIKKWQDRPVGEWIKHAGACLLEREDLSSRLGEIMCPALVVHGEDDTAITIDLATDMANRLPGSAGIIKVPGAHAANLTNPEPVNAAIDSFLSALFPAQ